MLAPACQQHPIPISVIAPAPDINELARQAVLSCTSLHTRRVYFSAIAKFIRSGHQLTRSGILAWVNELTEDGLGPSSINQHIAAVRKLVWEASLRGLVGNDELNAIDRIKGIAMAGTRSGNWTTVDGIKALLIAAREGSSNTTRNQAIIAVLAGCGLRRAELCSLDWSQWQQRDGRWCFVDIVGKGGRVRTVPVPSWVADYMHQWKGESES